MSGNDLEKSCQFVKDNSRNSQAWKKLGELLSAIGDPTKAAERFQRAQILTRSDPLTDYRYPGEYQTLAITIRATIVALLIFSTVSPGLFLVMVGLAAD